MYVINWSNKAKIKIIEIQHVKKRDDQTY